MLIAFINNSDLCSIGSFVPAPNMVDENVFRFAIAFAIVDVSLPVRPITSTFLCSSTVTESEAING